MQDVDCLLKLCDVHHPVDAASVADANLSCTSTHTVEWLPIRRLKPGLDLPQFKASFLPGVFWERQQIVVGRPYPSDLFFIIHAIGMYKLLYAPSGASQAAAV